jgi:hypothetical protein
MEGKGTRRAQLSLTYASAGEWMQDLEFDKHLKAEAAVAIDAGFSAAQASPLGGTLTR